MYKKSGENYYLTGAQLWNMSTNELENKVRAGWENVRNIIEDGLILTQKETKRGPVITNNFPDKSENEVIHIRPHAPKRFYVFEDGSTLGDGNLGHTDELPDGRRIPKHSFWINNTYIISKLKKELL